MKKAKTYRPPSGGNKKFTKKREYDTASWVEYRNKFLALNPLCYACGSRATVVDHWKAHKGSKELFWKEDNYIPLCKSHHDFITGMFDRHNPPKTDEKLKWLAKFRMDNDVTIRVKILSIKLKRQISDDIPSSE